MNDPAPTAEPPAAAPTDLPGEFVPDADPAEADADAAIPGLAGLPAPRGLLAATAIIATIGVVSTLIGLGLLLRTVHSPIQDCGTIAGFLLDGRADRQVDPTDPTDGISRADAEAALARGCRARVADAGKPAGILIAGGMVVALGAALTEVTARSWGRHRRRRSARRSLG